MVTAARPAGSRRNVAENRTGNTAGGWREALKLLHGETIYGFGISGHRRTVEIGRLVRVPTSLGKYRRLSAFGLHIQTDWYLSDGDSMLTAQEEWSYPEDPRERRLRDHTHALAGQQQAVLARLCADQPGRAFLRNRSSDLTITEVETRRFGEFVLHMTPNLRLHVFPNSVFDENWRLVQRETRQTVVMKGGRARQWTMSPNESLVVPAGAG